MMKDFQIAFRQLRKSPGFAVTAIITLALGIGANAVVFSVLNAVVLRPVNVPNAQNLYMVQRFAALPRSPIPTTCDLRDRNRTFESLALYNISRSRRESTAAEIPPSRGPTWPAETTSTCSEFSRCLGRFFHASDEQGTNSAPYVVLSYAYWHSHFHDDAGVVGRMVLHQQAPVHHHRRSPAGLSRNRAVLRTRAVDPDGRAARVLGLRLPAESRRSLRVRHRPGSSPE